LGGGESGSVGHAITENSKIGEKNHGKSKFSLGDGRYRDFAFLLLGCQEVTVIPPQDFYHSRVTYNVMDLRSFRVQIASGSLELEVQHDELLLAESCGCPWLEHLCLERALEDSVGKISLD
jgi:hypothetical protein